MLGSARRVVWKAEERLIARIASHFSTGNSSSFATCLDPRVVDKDVNTSKRVERLRHQSGDLVGLRHVRAEMDRADAEIAFDRRNLGGDRLGGRKAVEHDAGARTGKRARDAKAYSACGAGDERDLAVERMSGWGVALHDFDVHREVLLQECSVAFDLRRRQDEAPERLAEISVGYRVDAGAL
jgi:hypothetical protein